MTSTIKSVGIIPDGNRRWARQNNIDLNEAYWIAMQKLTLTISVLFDLGIPIVCTYLISKDNLTRPREDLESVLRAEKKFLTDLLPPIKKKYNLNIFHAGDPLLLPEKYLQALNHLCSRDNPSQKVLPSLFLCAGYDPIDEISQNISKIRNNKEILDCLWVPHNIDLVIRTGGNQRISGFLPLQCRYAEFFFEPYYFPEITQESIKEIVKNFQARERRFGQ